MYEDVCMDTAIVHIATLIVASAAQEERDGHLGGRVANTALRSGQEF